MENEGDMFGGILSGTLMGDFFSQGLYKIGTTTNPLRRWQQVQVHSPWDLNAFALIPGGYELESEMHSQLAEHRIRGEWFGMSRHVMFELLESFDGRSELGQSLFPSLPWRTFIQTGVAQ